MSTTNAIPGSRYRMSWSVTDDGTIECAYRGRVGAVSKDTPDYARNLIAGAPGLQGLGHGRACCWLRVGRRSPPAAGHAALAGHRARAAGPGRLARAGRCH